jgi:hypothetical protein
MKTALTLCVALAFCLTTNAQEKVTPAEKDFLANGPRLFTMEEALKESARTGRPTICWMGKHLFANESARKLSRELGETTIQAAMDTDGTEYDSVGFRVKFSDNNYQEGKTYYIRLANMDRAGTAEKILATTRGGK